MSFALFGSGGGSGASKGPNSDGDDGTSGSGSSAAPQMDLSSLLPEGWEENGGVFTKTLGTLLSNPYFSAGAGLWVLTVGGALGSRGYAMAEALGRRRFLISMEMANTDNSYSWMMRWLSTQEKFKTQQMSVITKFVQTYSNDSAKTECMYTPCIGVRHWFFYKGRPISLMRRRNEQRSYDGEVFETLQFTTYGLSSVIFQDMMAEAQRLNDHEDTDRTVIYLNGGGRWLRQPDPRRRRPFDSVILPDDIGPQLLVDVKQFLSSSEYYRNLGVPYRRGYLLHGPPGCGKTSYVMALAGELRLSICLLSLSNRGLNDESLMSLLNSAEMHSVVLMEDIDRAFSNDSNVTMSGLLNALDGIGAQEGRIVFMTTNHIERLDAALIRPGRADVKVEVGLLDHTQAGRMYGKFFPDAPLSVRTAFAKAVPPNTVSAAQIQSHLFFHRSDPEGAIDALGAFLSQASAFDSKLKQRRDMDVKMRELPRPQMLHVMAPEMMAGVSGGGGGGGGAPPQAIV